MRRPGQSEEGFQLRVLAREEGYRLHATRFDGSHRAGQFLLKHVFRDQARAFRMRVRVREHLLEGGSLDLSRWEAVSLQRDEVEKVTM